MLPPTEPEGLYKIQLVAFNGNGESRSTSRLVSLSEVGASEAAATCNCDQSSNSTSALLVGVHSGLACILCFLLFILLGYRRSFFCKKTWAAPPTMNGARGSKGVVTFVPQVLLVDVQQDATVAAAHHQQGDNVQSDEVEHVVNRFLPAVTEAA
ncbi:immunoglobulin superfamily DCC subclass member 3-like, partial [Oryzias melastigma]|uniref:immunoglobulin superfamily DCC subclass member 3-like n=1 Tax=Oryzias melastigma TaxID=30732 RepID=UPI00168CB7D3